MILIMELFTLQTCHRCHGDGGLEEHDLDPSPPDSGGVSRAGHPKSTDRATAETYEDELKKAAGGGAGRCWGRGGGA